MSHNQNFSTSIKIPLHSTIKMTNCEQKIQYEREQRDEATAFADNSSVSASLKNSMTVAAAAPSSMSKYIGK